MSTPNPSPTEEELLCAFCEHHHNATESIPHTDCDRDDCDCDCFISVKERPGHALRSARESARVATRERDEALRECPKCKISPCVLCITCGRCTGNREQDRYCCRCVGDDVESRRQIAYENACAAVVRLEAQLRAHEETIGRLRDTLTDVVRWYDNPRPAPRSHVELRDHDGERDAIYQRARDALSATPPGECEARVRYNALDVAYCVLADHVLDLRANGRPAAQIDEAQTCTHIVRTLADTPPRSST